MNHSCFYVIEKSVHLRRAGLRYRECRYGNTTVVVQGKSIFLEHVTFINSITLNESFICFNIIEKSVHLHDAGLRYRECRKYYSSRIGKQYIHRIWYIY